MRQLGRFLQFTVFGLVIGALCLGGGCSPSTVPLGEWIEGTLTLEDSYGYDNPDDLNYFYWDTYRLPVVVGDYYRVELYADTSAVTFEGDAEEDILDASPSGASITFTAYSDSGKYYIYVNDQTLYDYGGEIDYRFRITEY